MDQQTYMTMRQIIGALYNSFPQGNEDIELRMETFARALDGMAVEAMQRAADLFIAGEVEGQDRRFAPSVPEFVQEVRRIDDKLEARSSLSRRALPPPSSIPPFIVNREKARAAHAHMEEWEKDVSHDRFLGLARAKQLPVGAVWVAALATIFVPRKA